MNIFFLDTDPAKAAAMLCDKHLSKMQLETAQLICTSFGLNLITNSQLFKAWDGGGPVLYKVTHKNHPSSVWTRSSNANLTWLMAYVKGMGDEWLLRGHKQHKSQAVSEYYGYLLLDNCNQIDQYTERDHFMQLDSSVLTKVPLCMPEQYYAYGPKLVPMAEAVQCYRNYYLGDKAYMAKWPLDRTPDWWLSGQHASL